MLAATLDKFMSGELVCLQYNLSSMEAGYLLPVVLGPLCLSGVKIDLNSERSSESHVVFGRQNEERTIVLML